MCVYQCRDTRNMKKKMTPPKEHNKSPVTDPKEKVIYKVPKKFKLMILRKLREIQVYIDNSIKGGKLS